MPAWPTSQKTPIRYSLFASVAYIHRKRPYSPFAIRYSLHEGGAGRPGSRPLASDLSARGAKNALLGRLRRPPDAWPAWPPCRAGYRRPASPQSAPPCPRACVEGIPGSFPAKSGVGIPRHRRSDGLSAMPGKVSDCGPRLLSEARCRPPHPHLRGARMMPREGACRHAPTYTMNAD